MTGENVAMIERRHKLLGSAYKLFYDNPVHIVKGEGVWLFDADGRKYLDMYNNVPHVGHCHPQVVEALTKQIATLNTHTRYLHDNILDYAERLTAKFEEELDLAMFCCTGSEANELAMRIARTHTGGTGFIATSFAYHGNTLATFEITTSDFPEDERPDHIATVPVPDTYRGLYTGPDAGEKYAAHVHEAIETLERRGVKPAAFIIDTIASSGGVVSPPPGYLSAIAKIVRDAGGLFIADEVQPGFGRTGRNFWGYQADGFVPDIVTMGKPMGNGHPLAGVVTRGGIVEEFAARGRYFNTFGGNPVSCAAGLAVLDVLEQEDLQQNALEVGQYLVDGLWTLAERHEVIGDVRGSGFFLGLELVEDRERKTPATDLTKRVLNELRERGLLTGSIGPDANILKLRCPMVFTRENADYALGIIDETLTECRS
ncbi:MAG: aminotransferase class III-fold pyridoxal phosphate-dependent enzyme [Gammaproteobacteria bacterium]|nr:aminotransferase class III-fold pyridoxal phosphate-dependent enzyme [Gammaproteobacteria bacterium]